MIAVVHNYPDKENEPSLLQNCNSYREIIVEGTNHWKHFEKKRRSHQRWMWTHILSMAPKIQTCALLVFPFVQSSRRSRVNLSYLTLQSEQTL